MLGASIQLTGGEIVFVMFDVCFVPALDGPVALLSAYAFILG